MLNRRSTPPSPSSARQFCIGGKTLIGNVEKSQSSPSNLMKLLYEDSPISPEIEHDVNARLESVGSTDLHMSADSIVRAEVAQQSATRRRQSTPVMHQLVPARPLSAPQDRQVACVQQPDPFGRLHAMCTVRMFAQQVQQFVDVSNLWQDTFASVVGLDDCKRVVYEYVCMPAVFPDLYARTLMPYHFALIGPSGCGRRTLVETTCQMRHINYVYMTSFQGGLLVEAITFARINQPCVIHLEDEFGDALSNATQHERTPFVHEYIHHVINSDMYSQWGRVWIAFNLKEKTRLADSEALLKTVGERVGRYAAAGNAEMVECMRRYVRTHHRGDLDKLLDNSTENMQQLAQAASEKTPAQIVEFFKRVYHNRLRREDPIVLCGLSADAALDPTWDDDFLPCMVQSNPQSDAACMSTLEIPDEYKPAYMDCDHSGGWGYR